MYFRNKVQDNADVDVVLHAFLQRIWLFDEAKSFANGSDWLHPQHFKASQTMFLST